jgi:hypothetical protein
MPGNDPSIHVDDETRVLALEVPGSKVVLLQAFFELYEGPGAVRTVDIKNSLLCIITTPSLLDACLEVLNAIQPVVHWRFATEIGTHAVEAAFDLQKQLGMS